MKKQSVIQLLDALKMLYSGIEDIKCLDYDKVLGRPVDIIINTILEECGLSTETDYPFGDVCNYIFSDTTMEEDKELFDTLFENLND